MQRNVLCLLSSGKIIEATSHYRLTNQTDFHHGLLDILIAQKVTEKIGEELKKMWRSGGVADSTPPDRQIAGKEAQSRPESSVESCAGEGRFLEYLCTIPGT